MRILVTGSRHYSDYDYFSKMMNQFCFRPGFVTDTIIHGAAQGVDTMAGRWVRETNSMRNHDPVITEIEEPAKWRGHGKAAGPIRNKLMLDKHKPDVVLAFPGGKGTANMTKLAKWYGVPVVTIGHYGFEAEM